jgi:hypothetical protein
MLTLGGLVGVGLLFILAGIGIGISLPKASRRKKIRADF